jgi:hypothetical protein
MIKTEKSFRTTAPSNRKTIQKIMKNKLDVDLPFARKVVSVVPVGESKQQNLHAVKIDRADISVGIECLC